MRIDRRAHALEVLCWRVKPRISRPPPAAVLLRPLQAARDIGHGGDSTPPVGFRKVASRMTPKRMTQLPIVLMYPATGRIVPCSASV